MRIRRAVVAALVGPALLAACTNPKDHATGGPTSARGRSEQTVPIPPLPSTTDPADGPTSTTILPAATSGPCRTGRVTIDADIPLQPIVDIDGDGLPDGAVYRDTPGHTTLVIRTAAGGLSELPIVTTSPIDGAVLVVNADRRGPVELLVSDGRQVQLYAFVDCRPQPVLNPQGHTYTFDVNDLYGTGTGIGCIETKAGRRLVGYHDLGPSAADPTRDRWTRTIVELDGLHAHNGPTSSGTYREDYDAGGSAMGNMVGDADAIVHLNRITCGNLDLDTDGVQEAP